MSKDPFILKTDTQCEIQPSRMSDGILRAKVRFTESNAAPNYKSYIPLNHAVTTRQGPKKFERHDIPPIIPWSFENKQIIHRAIPQVFSSNRQQKLQKYKQGSQAVFLKLPARAPLGGSCKAASFRSIGAVLWPIGVWRRLKEGRPGVTVNDFRTAGWTHSEPTHLLSFFVAFSCFFKAIEIQRHLS